MPSKYPAQTKQHQEAISAQVRLLDEAAVRIAAIDSILAQGQPWHPSLAVEFSYLQLRMLCETVALSCLAAHGDIEATRTSKLQKDYAADNGKTGSGLAKQQSPIRIEFPDAIYHVTARGDSAKILLKMIFDRQLHARS